MLSELKKKDYATLLGTLCGVFSIIAAIGYDATRLAMFMIFAGCFADLLDGYVARKTGEFNEFGIQLDSLSDAIVFGIAPSIIAFVTYAGKDTTDMGIASHHPLLMMVPTFLLIVGGIVRLAWFNVSEDKGSYEGVPVPVTATILVLLMLADYLSSLVSNGPNWFNYFMHYFVPIAMVILAWFNVSDRLKFGKTIRKKSGGMKFLFLFTGIFVTILAILVTFFRVQTSLYTLIMTLMLWPIWIWFITLGIKTANSLKKEKKKED
ncbi:hypothetical protein NEF87_000661 [Candidatus Lokiarchaeum ossiferum]|uniref:CDP-diacylglycerol--serine O-phosphatidyltransferase n=1 Tax=Candidatus Lokiarchaeum ossiferum TaxID=2951803 RepID=A0ABY6HLU2_9ARCH|nr:hypothetical protein NEF87_000661 [Candidatus Lokiarchaeum sp. B-35]